LHGHNWRVEAEVCGEAPGSDGLLIDFRVLRGMLNKIVGDLDHKMLNEIPAFKKVNPTSENVARFIYDQLSVELAAHDGIAPVLVRVHESDGSSAAYSL